MKLKYWLIGAAGSLVLGFAATTAMAAPTGAATGDLKSAAEAGLGNGVEQARYRRCRWHRGHRHCWYPRHRYHSHYYGRPRLGIYTPHFGFFIGPRHHRHRHWHRRHW